MRIIGFTIFVVICLVSSVGYAEEKAPYQMRAELFLTTVIEGQVDKAYEDIIKGSLLEQKTQETALLKQRTSGISTVIGKFLCFEFIKQENYGNSIVRLVYLLKAEFHPLAWEIYFYKPKAEWILIEIKFSTEVDSLK